MNTRSQVEIYESLLMQARAVLQHTSPEHPLVYNIPATIRDEREKAARRITPPTPAEIAKELRLLAEELDRRE